MTLLLSYSRPLVSASPCYFPLLFIICFVSLFSACSNKPAAPQNTFGEQDTSRIAADTSMQVNMDLSYEYQKTLVQNDSVVFDFLAYDRPAYNDPKHWEGKLIIIRRTNTRQDTIVKDSRFGPVKGLSLADLDHDGQPEILFYNDESVTKDRWTVAIYKHKPDGKYESIYWIQRDARSPEGHYKGEDTFFVYQDHLIRRFPYFEKYDDPKPNGDLWQSYKLASGKLVLENEKRAQ